MIGSVQTLAVTLLGMSSTLILSAQAQDTVQTDINVSVQFSVKNYDPDKPAGIISFTVANKSNKPLVLPAEYDGRTIVLHGHGKGHRGSVRLWRRGKKQNDSATVTIEPGKERQLFALPLKEILAPVLFGDNRKWGWDWRYRSAPPRSPIHLGRQIKRYVESAFFWAEIRLGSKENAVSEKVSLKVQPSQPLFSKRAISYVDYKDSDKNLTSLDVYAPATGFDHPVLIWIHGGGWRVGDKARVHAKPKAFCKNGFVLFSVNYRLAPAVKYKEQAADIAKAIHWVIRNGRKYGGSPERIYIMGHSAGAHLAALVATDHRYLKAEKLPLQVIKGVVLLDGAGYDIPRQIKLARPKGRKLYESVFGKDEKTLQDASPITHVAKGKDIPPFLIIHVAARPASKIQSEAFAKALRDAGGVAEVVPAKGKTHGTLNQDLGLPNDEPTRAVFEFLEELEKKADDAPGK